MTRNDIIKVEKESYKLEFIQPDGSFIKEDSYALTIGITHKSRFKFKKTIGELSKDDLVQIKEEIEKILKA